MLDLLSFLFAQKVSIVLGFGDWDVYNIPSFEIVPQNPIGLGTIADINNL